MRVQHLAPAEAGGRPEHRERQHRHDTRCREHGQRSAVDPPGRRKVDADRDARDVDTLPPDVRPDPATRIGGSAGKGVRYAQRPADAEELKRHDRRPPRLAEQDEDEVRARRAQYGEHGVGDYGRAEDNLFEGPTEARRIILEHGQSAKRHRGAPDGQLVVGPLCRGERLVVIAKRRDAEHPADDEVVDRQRDVFEEASGVGSECEGEKLFGCRGHEPEAHLPAHEHHSACPFDPGAADGGQDEAPVPETKPREDHRGDSHGDRVRGRQGGHLLVAHATGQESLRYHRQRTEDEIERDQRDQRRDRRLLVESCDRARHQQEDRRRGHRDREVGHED